ncbi:putative CCR4-associated factor 1 homolog 9 [Carex rostrata]
MNLNERTNDYLINVSKVVDSEGKKEIISKNNPMEVRSVWMSNLEEEFYMIKHLVTNEKYYWGAFDTKFRLSLNGGNPVEIHPRFRSPNERYITIKKSIDEGNIRQLGLTLVSSIDATSVIIWEFNFPAEIGENDLINTYFFSQHLRSSGLLKNPMMTWIMFHGAYDVAYLIKLANFWDSLPDTLVEFQSHVRNYLGQNVFDVKFMTKFTNNLHGGLEEVATALHVNRVVGMAHQAGSDSLLTWQVFKKFKQVHFPHDSGISTGGNKTNRPSKGFEVGIFWYL